MQPSLLDVIRIIVVLRPSVAQANDLILRAGYAIQYDFSPDVAIYREIISNLKSDDVDSHNRLLAKAKARSTKTKEVFRIFTRLGGYQS